MGQITLRPDVVITMMRIANTLAARSTCKKLSVGCVLTDVNNRILSAGYNGLPKGWIHCKNEGNTICNWRCGATHAESNALLSCYAPRKEIHNCYVTHSPCLACMKQLIQTGCSYIYYREKSDEYNIASEYWYAADRLLCLAPSRSFLV